MDNHNHNHNNIKTTEDDDEEYWGFNPKNKIITDDDCVVCLESGTDKYSCDYCRGICCIDCIRKMLNVERINCKVDEFEIKCPCCRKIGLYSGVSGDFENMVGKSFIYEKWKKYKTELLYSQDNDNLIPILMRYTDMTNRSYDFSETMDLCVERCRMMTIGINDMDLVDRDNDSDNDLVASADTSVSIDTDSDSDSDIDYNYNGVRNGYWWDTDNLLYYTDNHNTYQMVDSGIDNELTTQSRILLESNNIILDTIRDLNIELLSGNEYSETDYTQLDGNLDGFRRIENIRVDNVKTSITLDVSNMDIVKLREITKYLSENLMD